MKKNKRGSSDTVSPGKATKSTEILLKEDTSRKGKGGAKLPPFYIELKSVSFLRKFQINAMVLYPFVLYADAHPSEIIKEHEKIHLKQIQKYGVLGFYSRYVQEYLQGRRRGLGHNEAYRNISFEREAYGLTDKA